MMTGILEICVDTAEGADAAVAGGCDRIELTSALALGGLTPSAGMMAHAAGLAVPVFAMIRPHAGIFVFDRRATAIMLADIDAAADAGLAGVVLGASLADGRLDAACLERLVDHARELRLATTLHRAFDLVPDLDDALETAIDLGFDRVLTSGGAPSAPAGLDALAGLVDRAAGRIALMPGSGIRPETIAAVVRRLPVEELHASASLPSTASSTRARALGFEPAHTRRTSSETVRRLRQAWQDALHT